MKGDKIFEQYARSLFPLKQGEMPDQPEEESAGRSAELIAARNEQLMYRYHYYVANFKTTWPNVISLLSQEYYLSEVTVGKIVQANSDVRRRIMEENPTLEEMREPLEINNLGETHAETI